MDVFKYYIKESSKKPLLFLDGLFYQPEETNNNCEIENPEFKEVDIINEYITGNVYKIEKYENHFFSQNSSHLELYEVDEIKMIIGHLNIKRDVYYAGKLIQTSYNFQRLNGELLFDNLDGPAIINYYRNGMIEREQYKINGIDYSINGPFEVKYSQNGIYKVEYYNHINLSDFSESNRKMKYFPKDPLIILYENNEIVGKIFGIIDVEITNEKVEYNIQPHKISGRAFTSKNASFYCFVNEHDYCVYNHNYDYLFNKIGCNKFCLLGKNFTKNKFYNTKWTLRRFFKKYFEKKRLVLMLLNENTDSNLSKKFNKDILDEIYSYIY